MLSLLTLIGAIALFFFALRLVSEGLQKIAGDHLRHAQAAMTGHPVRAMLTGLGTTAFVQSSQATTMIAVSFVSAGIITLAQSMAVIMGANIGTTVTAWILATLGFRYELCPWAFPLIALALPFFHAQKTTANSWGELLLGVGLLFLSLESLEQACMSSFFAPFSAYTTQVCSWGYGGLCCYIVAGILLTALVRTSTTTFALTVQACSLQWITFPAACALMVGANIGTCIPALFVSRHANAMARRAALGHLLFNVVGLILSLCLFPWCSEWVAQLTLLVGWGDPQQSALSAPLGIALFHTLFNMVTMLLLLPLTRPLVRVVTRIVPEPVMSDDTSFRLHHINGDLVPTSGEIALVQVQKEVSRYAADTYRMFGILKRMSTEPMGSERQLEMHEAVRQMEQDSDYMELEIAQFLNHIQPQTLSMSGEQLSRGLYKVVDELESIADAVFHCATTLYQKSEQLIRFTPQMNSELQRMLSLTDEALQHTVHVLSLSEVPTSALNRAYNIEDEINNLRNQLRNQMLSAIERREVEYQQHSFFSHIIDECEKIGDHVINAIAAASV